MTAPQIELIEDFSDPISDAFQKLGITAETELTCRIFRQVGKTKEYVTTYDFAPDIEFLQDQHGGGSFQLQIEANGRRSACNVRIAGAGKQENAVSGFGVENLREAISLLKELQSIQPGQTTAPALSGSFDIMPVLFEQQNKMAQMFFDMQKNNFEEMQRMKTAYFEAIENLEDEEEEEGRGMDFDGKIEIEDFLPLIIEYLPKLLGPAGHALVPLLEQFPIFQQIRKSVDTAGDILDRLGVSDAERNKLIKLLKLPVDLIKD